MAYFSHSPEKRTPGSNNSLGKLITELESKCLSNPDGPGNVVHSPLYTDLTIFKFFNEQTKQISKVKYIFSGSGSCFQPEVNKRFIYCEFSGIP